MAKTVRVIRTDRTGHFQGIVEAETFRSHNWEAKREIVIINGVQVETFEDFMRAVDEATEEPEVLFFPPMAGGR